MSEPEASALHSGNLDMDNHDDSQQPSVVEGVMLIDKPKGITSFKLVAVLRRKLGVKIIGHAGTLDPFATGVMVLLVGKKYTRMADKMTSTRKKYQVTIQLGETTETYDTEGVVVKRCTDVVPTMAAVQEAVAAHFQGSIDQVPPMFSAKKIDGTRLYKLARKGEVVERKAVQVDVETTIVSYQYPELVLDVECSKGTYIRCIAHELGEVLGCGGHAKELRRLRSGTFAIEECKVTEKELEKDSPLDLSQFLIAVNEEPPLPAVPNFDV